MLKYDNIVIIPAGGKGGERDGGRSPGGGKATPPPAKEKIDHTTCEIIPGHDTVIEIIKVEIIHNIVFRFKTKMNTR